ncbi:unnamed protein product [Ectocarpus sp. CCAP 1310/34]|nr:unnamed protein product [Ectocarpus sp. CCAP 1310/34]
MVDMVGRRFHKPIPRLGASVVNNGIGRRPHFASQMMRGIARTRRTKTPEWRTTMPFLMLRRKG